MNDNTSGAYNSINSEGLVAEELNYREERRLRQVDFYPSSVNGTLKYQRIPMCGHKFIPGRPEPRHRNCDSCWFTGFQVNGTFTQAVEKVYQEQGEDFLVKLKGRRFVNNFLKFMSTVAAFQAAISVQKAQKENNEPLTSEED